MSSAGCRFHRVVLPLHPASRAWLRLSLTLFAIALIDLTTVCALAWQGIGPSGIVLLGVNVAGVLLGVVLASETALQILHARFSPTNPANWQPVDVAAVTRADTTEPTRASSPAASLSALSTEAAAALDDFASEAQPSKRLAS